LSNKASYVYFLVALNVTGWRGEVMEWMGKELNEIKWHYWSLQVCF